MNWTLNIQAIASSQAGYTPRRQPEVPLYQNLQKSQNPIKNVKVSGKFGKPGLWFLLGSISILLIFIILIIDRVMNTK